MITGVSHVALVVADLDRALSFYVELLGRADDDAIYVLDPDGHKLAVYELASTRT